MFFCIDAPIQDPVFGSIKSEAPLMFCLFQCGTNLFQLGAIESKMNDIFDSSEGIFYRDTFYNPMLSSPSGIHSFLYPAGFQGEFYRTM